MEDLDANKVLESLRYPPDWPTILQKVVWIANRLSSDDNRDTIFCLLCFKATATKTFCETCEYEHTMSGFDLSQRLICPTGVMFGKPRQWNC